MHDDRIPVVLDLVSDAVHSRLVSALVYAAVFLFVMRSALFVVLLWNPVSASAPPLGILQPSHSAIGAGGFASAGGTELGAPLGAEIAGKYVRADTGRGIANASMIAGVALVDSGRLLWQERYGLAGTMVDYAGMPVQGVYTYPGLPPRALVAPALSGNTSYTSITGAYNFRMLRLQAGLPAPYQIELVVDGTSATADGGQLAFTSAVASIDLLSPPIARRSTVVPLGAPLPTPILIRIRDARGYPLAGKRAVLVSAPRSVVEAATFLARPDMLLPRFAHVDNALSTVTDYAGRAAFMNVTITASTLATVRLDVVCDGVRTPSAFVEYSVVAPYPPSPPPVPGSVADLARVVLTIVRQPASTVREGGMLSVQPAVRVQVNISTGGGGAGWQLVPLPGARLIALPGMQAGLRTGQLVTPGTAREWGALAGSTEAVLSNMGQTKALTGFTSGPADATGLAEWEALGFTRHGPAGGYTLLFAYAGVHQHVETARIEVTTAVGGVLHVRAAGDNATAAAAAAAAAAATNDTAHPVVASALAAGWLPSAPTYNVTVCNAPACEYYIGNAAASPVYAAALADVFVNATIPPGVTLAPAGPSGYLPNPPTLRVTDAAGAILAGKAAEPRVYRRVPMAGGGVSRVLAPDVVVREYPYAGAATSVLSLAAAASRAADDGVIAFLPANVGIGATDALSRALATGHYGGFFRVVAAPPGTTTDLELVFAVEGVESAPASLTVVNLDAVVGTAPGGAPVSPACGYLEVVSTPTRIMQVGASVATGDSPFEGPPFIVQAYDSFGTPMVPPTNVQQHAVDFVGIAVVTPLDLGFGLGPSPPYLTYLLRMGGGAAFAMGNYTAVNSQQLLMPPICSAPTNATGAFTSAYSGLKVMQHTYMRYVFASIVRFNATAHGAMPTSGGGETGTDWFPAGGCYSQYSPPVPVDAAVAAVEWLDPPASSDNVTCVADGVTHLSPAPQPVMTLSDGSVAEGMDSVGLMVAAFDASLATYPSHEGVVARDFATFSVFYDELGFPSVRLDGDPSASVLLPPDGDHVMYGNLNPMAALPFASMAQTLWQQRNASLPPQPPGPADVVVFETFSTTVLPGKSVGTAPPLAQRVGAPGSFSFVAVTQGVVSEPWARVVCGDNVSAVGVTDYAVGAAAAAAVAPNLPAFSWTTGCPADIGVYYADENTPPSRIASLPATPGCPNACSGHGFCVCGVCVCTAPWDGAPDCSVAYTGDAWASTFTADALYRNTYGGLPVVDLRAVAEVATQPGYLYDALPRLLLAGTATVGAFANVTTMAAYVSALLGPAAILASASNSMRLADTLSAALAAGLVPGGALLPAPAQGHRVFPVLVTCDGKPVEGAYFTPVTPLLDRCSDNGYPLPSSAGFTAAGGTLLPNGNTNWDTYLPIWVADNASAPLDGLLRPYVDRRVLLRNVPTGCYRFKYVYGFNASGSFAQHAVPLADALASGRAVSIGASRPFRLLAPVVSMEVAQWPSLFVPFDSPLPTPPILRITVRAPADDVTRPLVDDCQLTLLGSVTTFESAALRRCPVGPVGGFPVYVSAVAYSTGVEVPLYLTTVPNDCARAGNMTLTSVPNPGGNASVFQQYTVSFDGLQLPSAPAWPTVGPGASHRAATAPLQLQPGAYFLRFNALGTVLQSPFAITVQATADALEWVLPPAMAAAGGLGGAVPPSVATAVGIDTTVRTPLSAPAQLAVRALIDSTRGLVVPQAGGGTASTSAVRFVPAPNVLVSLTLVDGPVDANAALAPASASAVTDATGVAYFPAFTLATGTTGRYVILASSAGVTCNRSAHALVLNVTNPVAALRLTVNGAPPVGAAMGASYGNPVVIDISEPVSVSLRVCADRASATAAAAMAGLQLTMATRLDSPPADDSDGGDAAATSTWAASNTSSACAAIYTLPTTPTSVVDTPQGGSTYITAADGCVTLPNFVVTGLASSTRLTVTLSTAGVTSAAAHFAVLTPADAHPFRVSDLQNQIPVPFGLALGPLMANEVYFGRAWRGFALAFAIAMVVAFWVLGGARFVVQLRDIEAFYAAQDATYVQVLQALFMLALAAITAALAVAVVLAAAAAVSQWRSGGCTGMCTRRRGTGTGGGSRGGAPPSSPGPGGSKGGVGQPIPAPRMADLPYADAVLTLPPAFASHAAVRHAAFLRYTAQRRPRVCAPLLTPGEQQLSPPFVEALTHVFQRYAATAFAEDAAVPVAGRRRGSALDGAMWARYASLPGSAAGASLVAGGILGGRPGGATGMSTSSTPSAAAHRGSATTRRTSIQSNGHTRVTFVRRDMSEEEAAERRTRRACCGAGALWVALRRGTAGCCGARGSNRLQPDQLLASRMTAAGVARLRTHLLALHTGLGAATGDGVLPLPIFIGVLAHRLATFGPLCVLNDLRRAATAIGSTSPAAAPAPDGSTLVWADVLALLAVGSISALFTRAPGAGRAEWRLSAVGHRVATSVHAVLVARATTTGTVATAPAFLDALDPPLAAMWARLFGGASAAGAPPSLFDLLAAYHERLLRACEAPARGSGNGGGRPLLQDSSIWQELAAWGFDHTLRYRLLDASGRLAPQAHVVLATAFAHASDTVDAPSACLTWEELTAFRESLGLPPVRRDFFLSVSRARVDVDVDAVTSPGAGDDDGSSRGGGGGVVLNPLRAVPEAASLEDDVEGVGSRAHSVVVSAAKATDTVTAPRVGPAGYVELARLLYGDVALERHLRRVLRQLGYTERLLWIGEAAHDDGATGVMEVETMGSGDLLLAYAATLQARAVASAKSGGATAPLLAPALLDAANAAVGAARARLSTPVFIPQRLWIAVALSCAMVAVLVVVACSLTDQLITTINNAVADLIRLRAQVLASVNDTLAMTAALGNQYLQSVLSGAVGAVQAGPASFVADAVTSGSIDAFLSGKAAGAAAATAVVAAGGAAAASVGVDGYLQAALAAASGVAGQLPAAVDAASSYAQEQAVGMELSAAGAAAAAVAGAENLLVSQFPGGADILRNILTVTSPAWWQSVAARLTDNVTRANVLAIVLGVALVTGTWVAILAAYAQKVRRARAGVYPFIYRRVNVGGASRFLGVQASLTALSFIITYLIVFVLYVVFSLPGLMAYLWDVSRTLILSLIGVSLALRLMEQVLLYVALARGSTIRYRRLYMLADVWASFLSTVVGFIVALLRFVPFLPLACLALMRSDISLVGPQLEPFDGAKAVYNAMLLQNTQHSHPIAYAFSLFMLEVLAARRAVAGGTGKAVLNPMTARPLRVGSSEASGGIGVSGGAGVDDDVRRRRVRNRWHMAVLLAVNPSLRESRVRDLPLRPRRERAADAGSVAGGGEHLAPDGSDRVGSRSIQAWGIRGAAAGGGGGGGRIDAAMVVGAVAPLD